MDFNNPAALRAQIERDLGQIQNLFSDVIVQLLKDSVQKVVYDPWENREMMYQRSYEFRESWTWAIEDEYTNKIFSDPNLMQYNPPQHGRATSGNPEDYDNDVFLMWSDTGDDRREIMAEAVAEGTHYDFYHHVKEDETEEGENWWTRPRDYFTPVLDTLSFGTRAMWLEDTFKKNRIQFRRDQ